MPRIRRQKLPQAVVAHLLLRMRQRSIRSEHLVVLARWLDTEPEVPEGKWFRRFGDFIVCGEGELVKTFLLRNNFRMSLRPNDLLHGQFCQFLGLLEQQISVVSSNFSAAQPSQMLLSWCCIQRDSHPNRERMTRMTDASQA